MSFTSLPQTSPRLKGRAAGSRHRVIDLGQASVRCAERGHGGAVMANHTRFGEAQAQVGRWNQASNGGRREYQAHHRTGPGIEPGPLTPDCTHCGPRAGWRPAASSGAGRGTIRAMDNTLYLGSEYRRRDFGHQGRHQMSEIGYCCPRNRPFRPESTSRDRLRPAGEPHDQLALTLNGRKAPADPANPPYSPENRLLGAALLFCYAESHMSADLLHGMA